VERPVPSEVEGAKGEGIHENNRLAAQAGVLLTGENINGNVEDEGEISPYGMRNAS
jgi:hypothetical protein